mgnify:CR=1 FL=1
MRILHLIILCVFAATDMAAQPTYNRTDSITICRLLSEAPRGAGALWFANRFMDVPYVAHTLEVNAATQERLVVNTRQMDCTTLVETVTALTLCAQAEKRHWQDYLDMLRKLRYRQGRIKDYTSRLHYFSDWIVDKERMSFVKEIQGPNPPFTAVQLIRADYMSRHADLYQALKAHPGLVPAIRRQEQELTGTQRRYIPKDAIQNSQLMRQTIRDGDIIAITCDKKGLDIAHLGFAVWRADGLHLLNASQLHKKVVTEPMTLSEYLRKHPSHTGIRVVRIVRQ